MSRSLSCLIIGILIWGISSLVVPSLGIHSVSKIGILMIAALVVWLLAGWGFVESRRNQVDRSDLNHLISYYGNLAMALLFTLLNIQNLIKLVGLN